MKNFRITLQGRVHQVSVEVVDEPAAMRSPAAPVSGAAIEPPAPPASPVVAPAAAGEIRSPLSGKLVSIDVRAGQGVAEGAQVATIEAMKMNTYVFAPRTGIVTAVVAVPGEAVEENEVLLTIG